MYCRWYHLCAIGKLCEAGNLDRRWVERYCLGKWEKCNHFTMAEKGEPIPRGMLPDGKVDENLLDVWPTQ
ncbi:MAG: uracil-DNA glycosylase [Thermoplasmata archaeon HGW-Thermoplasmata-1]|nr:MAG: uracil-DNA glycosylase [Thermoplasmata archaeon HGW-Thermoplasmata-1]